ncbi:MAG: NYN domain-containing protein [Bernardetiaceae bacterium]
MSEQRNGLKRIGVFYDGNYLYHVNNYYRYEHERHARLSIGGLHEFIRHKLSELEKTEIGLCHIVDAHYFRGRLSADDARDQHRLYQERQMDDLLMQEGVVTHYLPLKSRNNRYEEKGIDVWLALEAYELTTYKEFNIVVLVASDGDYVPLIRKLNTKGARVMVLSWDFEYTTSSGRNMVTRTSQALLEEVAYPIAMHEIIDNRVKRNDPLIRNLFVAESGPHNNGYYGGNGYRKQENVAIPLDENGAPRKVRSRILSVLNGFGFIEYPPNNLFFHHTDVKGEHEFADLREGDKVRFTVGTNDKGEKVARTVELVLEDDYESAYEAYENYTDDQDNDY